MTVSPTAALAALAWPQSPTEGSSFDSWQKGVHLTVGRCLWAIGGAAKEQGKAAEEQGKAAEEQEKAANKQGQAVEEPGKAVSRSGGELLLAAPGAVADEKPGEVREIPGGENLGGEGTAKDPRPPPDKSAGAIKQSESERLRGNRGSFHGT